ncbi:hypothetical protein INT44_004328, partial [Umbelopsis vinacea]
HKLRSNSKTFNFATTCHTTNSTTILTVHCTPPDMATNGLQQFGSGCFTPEEHAFLQEILAKQLGPEWVSQRPGPAGVGKMVYVEGHTIINLANKLFGFNGWSSEIKSMTTDYIDVLDNGKMNICISVVMRVTLKDGTFHEVSQVNCTSTTSCHTERKSPGYRSRLYGELQKQSNWYPKVTYEKAKKEAVTDATKRAIRYFGSVMGNCIHDKIYMRDIVRIAPPTVRTFNKRKLDPAQLYRESTPTTPKPVPHPTAPTVASTSSNNMTTRPNTTINMNYDHNNQNKRQKTPPMNPAQTNVTNGQSSSLHGHREAQTAFKHQPEPVTEANDTKPRWQEDSFTGYEDDNSFLEQLAEADFDYADGEMILEGTDGTTSGLPQKRIKLTD